MDPIANFAHALDIAHGVIAGVPADKWTAPSPCTEWDARGVLNHLIGGVKMVAVCVPGGTIDHAALGGDLGGSDPAGTFRVIADDAVAAFRNDPSVLGRPVKMPFGEMPGGMVIGLFTNDAFVHAWDLARATGQSTDLDPQFAQGVMAAVRGFVTDDFRKPGFFDAEKPAPAGATAADQVAACSGNLSPCTASGGPIQSGLARWSRRGLSVFGCTSTLRPP